jgi:hypothetical protein
MPSPKHFDKWTVRRGIAPRGKAGKFQNRSSLKFAISNSVYHTGLKTTNFFTEPFEKLFTDLPDDVVEAYGLELDKFLESSINN